MAVYAAGEVARMLGVAPLTLRKWNGEFASWLSPDGDAQERHYTDGDMRVLRRAADLLKLRRGYAHVRGRLASEFGAVERERAVGESQPIEPESPFASTEEPRANDAEDAPDVVEAEVIEPEPQVPPDIAALLDRMAELYRELLRNKEQEIAALRQALDTAELAAANERRELEMLNKLTKIMERENQRLTDELDDARRRLGQAPDGRPTLRARLMRWLGRREEAQSAPQT